MSNKLIDSFLANSEMGELYKNYLIEPTAEKKFIIEKHFKMHVKKIKMLSYFNKVLHFEAQRFDKKKRIFSNFNMLILDGEDNHEGSILFEASINRDNYSVHLKEPDHLEGFIEDKQLFNIISKLSLKNKELLYLLYVKEMDESEVAKHLGITKQAVNKRKNNILHKTRDMYFNK